MKLSLVLLIVSFIATPAFAVEPPDRPIGVEAKNWIAITDKLGFVVVATTEPTIPRLEGPSRQLLLNEVAPPAPAAGYFVIKTEDGWRRLVVMAPADLAAARARN